MPEFLEHRYNTATRTIMAVATMFIYILLLGAVTYSGALTIRSLAGQLWGVNVSLAVASLVIGLIAMIYVVTGGLKACAWADLIQGSALIVGGALIMFFAFDKLGNVSEAWKIADVKTGAVALVQMDQGQGAMERFMDLNRVRLNMFLPATDPVLPWTALLLGLWIPNFYYWGLNQYITQRTLGSASLAQGQKGIVFAAFMKLLIPFVIVIPGIIAFNLFAKNMQFEAVYDNAPVISKYHKVNPQTQLVEVVDSPSEEAIAAWPQGRFMVALFDSEQTIKAIKARNMFVLPIVKSVYETLKPADFTTFASDDQSWNFVFSSLEAELIIYNEKTKTAAAAAAKPVVTEKFIAHKYDTALAQLLGNVLPQGKGVVGFVLAALLGAVVSSLAAMLNAASTIFSMDIYKKFMNPETTQKQIVSVGRISVVVFAVIAVLLAPQLGNPKISHSIFTIIQEGQGFISPGILAVFAFGLLVRKAPGMAGVLGLVTNIVSYGVLKAAVPQVQFLNRMAICFGLCLLVMAVITVVRPLAQPMEFKQNTTINLEGSRGAMWVGIVVVVVTLILYVIFSPLVIAK